MHFDLLNEYTFYQDITDFSLQYFSEMSSDVVSVKLRVHNNIYLVKLSPSGVTDVLLKGINSTIVQTITRGKADSVVTGNYTNPVEILSAINQSDLGQEQVATNEEMMEIEVNNALSYLSVFYLGISKFMTLDFDTPLYY